MSVALAIDNPTNKEEQDYYLPVAAERVFKQVWIPAAEALQLELVQEIRICLDVDEGNLEEFIGEVEQVRQWVRDNGNRLQLNSIEERAEILISELRRLFSVREDLCVSLG